MRQCKYCNQSFSDSIFPLHIQRCKPDLPPGPGEETKKKSGKKGDKHYNIFKKKND